MMLFTAIFGFLLQWASALPATQTLPDDVLSAREARAGAQLAQLDLDPFVLTNICVECLKKSAQEPMFACSIQCQFLSNT
jgi:hypothetical protein